MPRARAQAAAQRRTAQQLPVVLRATRDPDFRQDRARRSHAALLDAAGELFGAADYDAVGTPEIATRAGVSVGTFYRYFDDKHEIYLEITRRTLADAYRETIADLGPERFEGRARRETISTTIVILFGHVMSKPGLTRSFEAMALRDPAVAEVMAAFEQLSVARIAELITSLGPQSVVPDPEATAWVLYNAAIRTANGLAGHYGHPPIDAERARRVLADVIERAMYPGVTGP